VWDEFYHGLTIRGSILYLLTRGAYALVAAMISVALAAWLWRQSRFLGPPRVILAASRRTLREYVEAMARFFKRGAESQRFMLEEVERGVLWTLRSRVGLRAHRSLEGTPPATEAKPLGPGQHAGRSLQRPSGADAETLEALVKAVSRHDAAAGERLREAIARADKIISGGSQVGERQILEAVKGLASCL
jgi:electron transfer flavoprotein alpha subunit